MTRQVTPSRIKPLLLSVSTPPLRGPVAETSAPSVIDIADSPTGQGRKRGSQPGSPSTSEGTKRKRGNSKASRILSPVPESTIGKVPRLTRTAQSAAAHAAEARLQKVPEAQASSGTDIAVMDLSNEKEA